MKKCSPTVPHPSTRDPGRGPSAHLPTPPHHSTHARTRRKASNYYKQRGLNILNVRWQRAGPTGPRHCTRPPQESTRPVDLVQLRRGHGHRKATHHPPRPTCITNSLRRGRPRSVRSMYSGSFSFFACWIWASLLMGFIPGPLSVLLCS